LFKTRSLQAIELTGQDHEDRQSLSGRSMMLRTVTITYRNVLEQFLYASLKNLSNNFIRCQARVEIIAHEKFLHGKTI